MPGEFLVELPQNLANGFWTIAVPIWEAGVVAAEFTFDALRAHFNVIARHTSPFEKELLKTKPPKQPSELNTLGQVALFPLIILSWLLAATVAPLVYNSVILFLVGFVRTFNLSFLDKPKFQLTLAEGKMPWYRIIFGLLGLILGASFGLAIAGLVVIIRAFEESSISLIYSLISAINLALDPEDEFKDSGLEHDTRETHEIFGFGFLGVVAGIPLGSLAYLLVGLGRMVLNSIENIKRIGAATFNLIRHENDPIKFTPKEPFSDFRKYFLGLPGLVLGFMISPLVIITAVAERMAIQGFERAKQIYADLVFQALSPSKQKKKATREQLEEQPKIKQDSNWDRYFFNLPGIPFGILAGIVGFVAIMVWRSSKNSRDSLKNLTFSAINLVRHEDEKKKQSLENDKRSFFRKYILGFPGLAVGSVIALIAIGYEILRRFAIESYKTGKTVSSVIPAQVPYFTADEVNEKDAAEPAEMADEKPERSLLDQAFFGGPGALLGGIWGILLFTKDLTIHILDQSYESMKHSIVLFTNLGLDKDDKIKVWDDLLTDKRSTKQIYGFGLPGIILGSIAGFISLFAAAFGWNSIVTAKGIILVTLEAVREEQSKDAGETDSRHWFLKYGLGFPGVVLGSLAALFVVIALGSKKIGKQSWETAKEIVDLMVNEILPEEQQEGVVKEPVLVEKRTNFNRFVFGGLGILPGLFIGNVIFAYYFVKRTYNESLETAKRLIVSGMNLIRHEDEQVLEGIEHDIKRRPINKFGFGFPGLVFGFVVTVLIAIPYAILRRAAFESWESGKAVFLAIARWVNPNVPEEQSSSESEAPAPKSEASAPKERLFADEFLFGGLGIVLGAILGAIYTAGIILKHFAVESLETTKLAFVKITVNTLNENEETEFLRLLTIDHKPRTAWDRYFFGFIGILIGSAAGLLASALIIAGKFIIHNCKSWWALSGSFLNGSLSQPLFNGLGGDARSGGEKTVGGLGYVLALATTLPISLIIFTIKKAVPVISALLLGLAVSPIVALIKGISLSVEEPRFKNDKSIDNKLDDKLQPFKNIYSSLTIWGQLPEGEKIAENQTGQKGAQSFVRKAITLNTSTLDETILNKMLAAFKAWKGTPEEFFDEDGEYQRVVKEIKNYYKSTSCLQLGSTIVERENQIDEIGKFVKNYILGKQKQVPENLYSNPKNSWSAIFWGATPAKNAEMREQVRPALA